MAGERAPVLLDVSRLIARLGQGRLPTGVDRVALAYVRHFGPRAQAVVQRGRFRRIASPHTSQELFELLEKPDSHFRQRWHRIVRRALLSRWPSQDGGGRIYLNVGHTGLGEPDFGGWLRRSRLRPVFMVHDLIPLLHPEFCREGESRLHDARMRAVARWGAGVVSNSWHTLNGLNDFARVHALRLPEAVVVAPLGCDAWPCVPADAAPLPQPYFVMVGTIEPRKNHWLMLQLWRELSEELGSATPTLVLIGQQGWQCQDVADLLLRSSGLRRHVRVFSQCSDAQMAAYLTHARALLFPSFAEGYGLPLVEALSAGLPVLCSDLPAFREVAGAVPDYLSAIDGAGWRQGVLDFLQPSSPRRSAQLLRLKNWQAPRWDRHFDCVESLMERLR